MIAAAVERWLRDGVCGEDIAQRVVELGPQVPRELGLALGLEVRGLLKDGRVLV